jgi:hypothetical protein
MIGDAGSDVDASNDADEDDEFVAERRTSFQNVAAATFDDADFFDVDDASVPSIGGSVVLDNIQLYNLVANI